MHATDLKLIMADLKLPPIAASADPDHPSAGQTSYTQAELLRLCSHVETLAYARVKDKINELESRIKMGG